MELIRWLDERRQEMGFNHEQFAEWIGISQGYWSRLYAHLETGKPLRPSSYLLEKVRAKYPEQRHLVCDLAYGIPPNRAA